MIGVEWEKKWETDIEELRKELGIYPAPVPFKEWRKVGRALAAEKKRAEESS